MSLDIVTLQDIHLEDAARLVCQRYRALCTQVPVLPLRYGDVDTLLPKLQGILDVGPAVVALQDQHVVGFMAAWLTPSFRGRRASFSPEWANATLLEDGSRILEAMYTHVASAWAATGYATHLVNTLASDTGAIAGWPWMGFGMVAADAVRDLSPVQGADAAGVSIRRAGIEDLEEFMDLESALARYLADAPTFLVGASADSEAEAASLLEDPEKVVWLATQEGRPIAYLLIGPASEDASTIIYDEGTCSITGAYTRPEARGSGAAAALLNRALAWARDEGYSRCAVDFEPMNPLARRFWLRSFAPVCYSFGRSIA